MSGGGVGDDNETGGVGGLTRRSVLFGLPLALGACQLTALTDRLPPLIADNLETARSIYGPVNDEPFPIPAVDLEALDAAYYRRTVRVPPHIPNKPGEIVVDPYARYLYLVQEDDLCIRFGCGVGRAGFDWSGDAVIARKAEWPTWTPPAAMVARDPAARPWADGMPGGPDNPLGARAFYLYEDGVDTLYRVHGSPQAASIGQAISSGCIRLLNQDAIFLYDMVPIGTRVTVLRA
jgi:lipoprotein-anchoring transpeptidase ErfK/SrfK